MREAFPLYPLIWSPEHVPHGSSLKGRLFAIEEIDPSPGRGMTAIPAFCVKCEEETDAIDGLGRRTRTLVGQAVRVPMAYGLERLKPLVMNADGSPSASIAMMEFVAVTTVESDGPARHFIQVYVHDDPLIARTAFEAPKRYAFDVYDAAAGYNELQQKLADENRAAVRRVPDTLPPPVEASPAVASSAHNHHRIEPGPSDIPHT